MKDWRIQYRYGNGKRYFCEAERHTLEGGLIRMKLLRQDYTESMKDSDTELQFLLFNLATGELIPEEIL